MKKLMVIAVLLVFMTGSAYAAADWNFYGSARVNTFYSDFEQDPFSSGAAALGMTAGSDTKNWDQNLYGNARIGAKVKVSDTLTGHFEYGALSGNANIRILWGEWNFGVGSLGVGQNYTPLLFPYSNQVYSLDSLNKGDHNMSTFGMLYGGREAMVRLKFGNFQIAAVQPRVLVALAQSTITGATSAQPTTESVLPNIQAKYKFDFDKGHVAVAGGWQHFEVQENSTEYDVTSYVLGIGGRLNVGAAYFKGNIWGGQNVGNLADILVSGALWSTTANANTSTFDGNGWGFAEWNGTANTLTDNDALAALLVAGYEIRKGLYVEAGYGHVQTEYDRAAATKNDADTYYVQSTIFLAPGVFITPEIGLHDSNDEDEPRVVYFGAKWQINF